jgi:hypothetical protein
MESEFRWFVGIDWGGESHQVCVLDRDRRKWKNGRSSTMVKESAS